MSETARAEAQKRYSGRLIEDHDGDRYVEDEYGYDVTAREAFVAGAAWQTEQIEAKGSTIVANAARIAAESGAPVEGVTAALVQATDVWRRYEEMAAVIERAKAVPSGEMGEQVNIAEGEMRELLDTANTDTALREHDEKVRAEERHRIESMLHNMRPEMGSLINIGEYRKGKDDALAQATTAIREGRA